MFKPQQQNNHFQQMQQYLPQGMHAFNSQMLPQQSATPNNENSIFIGDIEPHITEEILWSTFAVFGQINKVKLFRDKVSGKSKGCSIIEFVNHKSVQDAIDKKNLRKIIPMKDLDSKLEDKSQRIIVCQKKSKQEIQKLKQYNLYFKSMESDENLSKGLDLDESVVEIFSWLSKFGEIHTAKFNEKKNKWLGFGYVMFSNQEACEKALDYDYTNESEDGGVRKFKIKFCKYKSSTERPHKQNNLYLKNFDDKVYTPEEFKLVQNSLTEAMKQKYGVYGQIQSLQVEYDQKTQKPFAFVCFHEEKDANNMFEQVKVAEPTLYINFHQKLNFKVQEKVNFKYLHLKNLKSTKHEVDVKKLQSEGTPEDEIQRIKLEAQLTEDEVKANIIQATNNLMENGSIVKIKCQKPIKPKYLKENQEESYWAIITFEKETQGHIFLQNYMNDVVCKNLFINNNPHQGATICLRQEVRLLFNKSKKDDRNWQQGMMMQKTPEMQNQRGNFQADKLQFSHQQQMMQMQMPMMQNMMMMQGQQPGGFQQRPQQQYQNKPYNQYNQRPPQGGNMMPKQMHQQSYVRNVQPQQQRQQNPNYPPQQFRQPPQQHQQQQQQPQNKKVEQQVDIDINLEALKVKENLEQFIKLSKAEQKQQLGPIIFRKVKANLEQTNNNLDLAPKITGMLIDFSVFEITDIIEMLETDEDFKERVNEAILLINQEDDKQ